MRKLHSQPFHHGIYMLSHLIISNGSQIGGIRSQKLCKNCNIQSIPAGIDCFYVKIFVTYIISNA
jgi:hypothetical protein